MSNEVKWKEKVIWEGCYPCPPDEKKCTVIHPDERFSVIHGEENKGLIDIFVSTDKVHFGIFYVSPFAHLDASAPHEGDEAYYVMSGEGAVVVNDMETYRIKAGDAFYLPAGLKHQWFNFGGERMDIVWAVAPKL